MSTEERKKLKMNVKKKKHYRKNHYRKGERGTKENSVRYMLLQDGET